MRLIDADTIDDVVQDLNENHNSGITRYEYKRITGVLFEMPTIDAVPVVRCKDCVHANITGEGYIYGTCNHRLKGGIGHLITSQFFCAYGERKDDATND